MRNHIAAAALAAAALALAAAVTACGPSSSSAAAPKPKAPHAASHRAKARPKAHASPACKRTTTFDYIIRTVWPPLAPSADEIGNTDYATCTSSLGDFDATAGQAAGECTTIALASDNPGYNVNAAPAPPLNDVIESAGPGC